MTGTCSSNVPQYDPQGVAQDVAQDLTEIQRKILEIIQKDPKITRAEIAVQCGKSVKTIERRLKEMSGIVQFVGSGFSGHWEIILLTDLSHKD